MQKYKDHLNSLKQYEEDDDQFLLFIGSEVLVSTPSASVLCLINFMSKENKTLQSRANIAIIRANLVVSSHVWLSFRLPLSRAHTLFLIITCSSRTTQTGLSVAGNTVKSKFRLDFVSSPKSF